MADSRDGPNIGELLDRVGRATRGLQFVEGLSPAQWEALRYVARANRYSRHPSALAMFLGATKGTVSQTLIALENKGYLRRERSGPDRRSVCLEITAAGKALLLHDPLIDVDAMVASVLSTDAREILAEGLVSVLRDLQRRYGGGEFGVCERCGLFIADGADGANGANGADEVENDGGGPHRCGLTGESFGATEKRCICVNFRVSI